MPAKRSHDAVDDTHHMLTVLEVDVRARQPPLLLNPDLGRAIDHDLANAIVVDKLLDGTVAKYLRDYLVLQLGPVGPAEDHVLLGDKAPKEALDLAADPQVVA